MLRISPPCFVGVDVCGCTVGECHCLCGLDGSRRALLVARRNGVEAGRKHAAAVASQFARLVEADGHAALAGWASVTRLRRMAAVPRRRGWGFSQSSKKPTLMSGRTGGAGRRSRMNATSRSGLAKVLSRNDTTAPFGPVSIFSTFACRHSDLIATI